MQYLQLLHLTDQSLTQLPDMVMFGWTNKYINHPKPIPKLHVMETKDKPNDN